MWWVRICMNTITQTEFRSSCSFMVIRWSGHRENENVYNLWFFSWWIKCGVKNGKPKFHHIICDMMTFGYAIRDFPWFIIVCYDLFECFFPFISFMVIYLPFMRAWHLFDWKWENKATHRVPQWYKIARRKLKVKLYLIRPLRGLCLKEIKECKRP